MNRDGEEETVCRLDEDMRKSQGNRKDMEGEQVAKERAGNRSYLHEVGRGAGWGGLPLGREFPL